jgi:glycerol-3-phosphate dehydrogenase
MNGNYDVVVIGAGIHGAGVAQAMAAAGYSTLVLEQQAVAWATSSRSSKLIHGGLRYLESAQFGLVRESLRERAILLAIAPELVRLVPFHIPVYRDTTRRPWQLRIGLSLYAALGGFAFATRFTTVARERWDELDGLTTEGLQAVFRYHDAQTDDARLTTAVLRSAQDLGAELACPARFVGAQREKPGWSVRFSAGPQERECRAHAIVNTAGPWVNEVLKRVTPTPPPLAIDLVQGAHLLIEGGLQQGIYYVEAPRDRRAVFVMPWPGGVLVGTTETHFHGDPAAVEPLPQEIEYLSATLRHYFPTMAVKETGRYAGLRVLPRLPGRAFHRPRDTYIVADDTRSPRLLSVCGGKLTGYRATAAKVVKRLESILPSRPARADTATLRLPVTS